MGFLNALFGGNNKNRVLKEDEEQEGQDNNSSKKKIAPLDALLGTGQYKVNSEESEDVEASEQLSVRKESLADRLGDLKIKMYKTERKPRFNKNKKRLEVGQGFDFKGLADTVYFLAQSDSYFRKFIGGRFDLQDRNKLAHYLNSHYILLRKLRQRLNRPNERRCVASFNDLFK